MTLYHQSRTGIKQIVSVILLPAHKSVHTFIYTEELASLQHSILGQNPVTKQKQVILSNTSFCMAYGCKR